MRLLDGKTALVTGVDPGMDWGIALVLATARAKVAVPPDQGNEHAGRSADHAIEQAAGGGADYGKEHERALHHGREGARHLPR